MLNSDNVRVFGEVYSEVHLYRWMLVSHSVGLQQDASCGIHQLMGVFNVSESCTKICKSIRCINKICQ